MMLPLESCPRRFMSLSSVAAAVATKSQFSR